MSDVPPQALEAEESVLGAMLLSPNAIGVVSDMLCADDFYRESHGTIYRAALDVYARSEPVDVVTLIAELERRGQLEDVGGKSRLHELGRIVPASANAKHYAEIVKEKAVLRGLIYAGKQIEALGWEGQEDPAALVEKAEELVLDLAPKHTNHSTVYTAQDVTLGFADKVSKSKVIDTGGVPAPWSCLPRLKGSRLYVLAGYTSDGKSAGAIQFFDTACDEGRKTMFVTNEMSEADLTARLVSQAGVPHHMCESGQIEPQYRDTVSARLVQINNWDFRLIDDEAIDLNGLRRHMRLHQPEFLIVDHLHRFHWKERRDLELTIRGITNLAREYDIPIVLLAQLNRSDWQNPFPRPSLIRLRETAILEQEAWAVWFIWRPRDEFHQPGEHAEFMVAKNRGGPLTHENMVFRSEFVRFDEKPVSVAPVAA